MFGVNADFSDKQLVAFLLIVGLILIVYPLLLSLKVEAPRKKPMILRSKVREPIGDGTVTAHVRDARHAPTNERG